MPLVPPNSDPSIAVTSSGPTSSSLGPDVLAERFRQAVSGRTARGGGIGLCYVGLPQVELFAGKGFPVLGLDIDASKVERLEAGQSYIGHITSARVAALRDTGRFS